MTAWPYPCPVDDGGAAHLVAHTPVPDLRLPSTLGGPVSLARVPGRLLVFVYPWTGRAGVTNPPGWDDIPGAHGSTPEAEGFRDHYAELKGLGLEVFGQDPAWQAEFAERLRLPFALLSDRDLVFGGALRLPVFEAGGVRYLKRLTLVIAGGRIERVVYPVHPPDRHAAEMLRLLP